MIAPISLAAFSSVPGIGAAGPPLLAPPRAAGGSAGSSPLAPFKATAPPASGQVLPRGSLLDLSA